MGIPIGQKYTATWSGSMRKECTCEKCGDAYVYEVQRRASGEGSSLLWLDNQGATQRAEAAAQRALQASLQRAVDLVACPSCGWFQKGHGSRPEAA